MEHEVETQNSKKLLEPLSKKLSFFFILLIVGIQSTFFFCHALYKVIPSMQHMLKSFLFKTQELFKDIPSRDISSKNIINNEKYVEITLKLCGIKNTINFPYWEFNSSQKIRRKSFEKIVFHIIFFEVNWNEIISKKNIINISFLNFQQAKHQYLNQDLQPNNGVWKIICYECPSQTPSTFIFLIH